MRSPDEVQAVRALVEQGLNDCAIARATGVPRATVRDWRRGRVPSTGRAAAPVSLRAPEPEPYAYLLGLYLGDGHLSVNRRGVYRLRVTLDTAYPGIVLACANAIDALMPHQRAAIHLRPRQECVDVSHYSKRWPLLFPQHGPGLKHLRPIALVDWQQRIVDAHPEALLRGLIHSDGWRGTNNVVVRGKRYAYPRYNFSNASDDIRRIFCDACDAVGVEWRQMNARNISVARRESVARLDAFIGPKR